VREKKKKFYPQIQGVTPGGAVSVVAAGGRGGTALEAEGEEALSSKGWVKTRRHNR
jgi:hypothetical protein